MRTIFSKLSVVVLMVSAMFVSCVHGNDLGIIPAFPSARNAEYVQSEKTGAYSWNIPNSLHKYTSANEWVGFEIDPVNKSYLNYYIEPNMSWTAKIVSGKEYLVFRVANNGGDTFDDSQTHDSYSVSGVRGQRKLTLKTLKTPAYGEEPVECELVLTMAGETMPLGVITLHPAVVSDSGTNN